MIDKIVWQPEGLAKSQGFNEYDFSINLDWDFAKQMFDNKISEERQDNFNKRVMEKIGYSFPLEFYENTSLLKSINLGQNGRWINIDKGEINKLKENKKEFLKYHSHNIDNLIDQHNLLQLFEFWVYYSPSLV
jgi:hypothetical protein